MGENSAMMRMEEAEIALRRGRTCKSSTENAHAVPASIGDIHSVQVLIAAEDIA